WPLRPQARYREFGGSFIYPLGEDLVTLGMVVGLDYRDAELSVHDLLQELKTHPLVRGILDGGERIAWGAKTIPEGGFLSVPSRLSAPGLLLCGDGAGLVKLPVPKGSHYGVEPARPTASSPSTSSPPSSGAETRRATTRRTTSASGRTCRARSRSFGSTCARRRSTKRSRAGWR